MSIPQLGPIVSEFTLYAWNRIITFFPSHHLRRVWLAKVMGFSIHPSSAIFMGCTFDAKRGLSIGQNSVINENCRIDTRGGIAIGKNVVISSEAVVLTATHDPRSPLFEGVKQSVHIHDFVWVGLRALILPGVTLGKGSIVAAGAVVTKSVQPGDTVAGVPARVIASGRYDLQYETSYRRLFH
jgi:acetyltransferase-like isoleucine patch superfamily enzyme